MGEDAIMRKISIGIILVISLLISMQFQVIAPPPRYCKGLEIHFYENSNEALTALKSGEVDIMQWSLTNEQYEEAVSDPTLMLAGVAENGMFEFDFNNNCTIADFPGVRSPMNELTFRQALAHAVDKDWIINEVLEGFGERIDAPIPAPQSGWANESVIGANYPYPYNLTRAAELLDIYFADTDEDGTRNYPVGWMGREDGRNLDPTEFYIRADHQHRLAAGRGLADNMRALGIPVKQIELCSDAIYPLVFEDRNYHIYTGGWSLGRRPTYLYGLYGPPCWCPGGSNYVTGLNCNGLSNYPDLDAVLEDVYYATDIEGFNAAVKKATGLLVADYCVSVWLWSYKSWWAYNKNLVGIANMEGTGLENTYTFLNAYKVDDSATPEDESQDPIRTGTIHPPKQLNVLYSAWYYDYAVLNRIFDSLLSVNPYDLSVDQPWIAQDWEVITWYDPQDGKNKTKVTYWIREDVFWHAPVTGEEARQFTAHDVEFTIWYIYAFDDCWQWSGFWHVDHTNVVDDFTIEVYFDTKASWLQYSPTGPLLPKDEYIPLLCGVGSASFYSDGTNCTESAKYVFTDDQVLQVISANINGTPLVEGVDFEIFATGSPDYTHNEIHFLTTLTTGTVTIDYYTPTVDPYGYYLGDLDWTLTFYSIGPYYPVDIVPGVGGHAILNCNPSHFLGASVLGEIDWRWTFTGTTKPRSGYYQVNLFDAVLLLKAYGSRGDAVPDPNWFAGADIDPTDIGHVGLYDAVTILHKYGTKWGKPPP